MADWQRCRAIRNMAAHDYATSYADIAEHFNLLQQLSDMLFQTSRQLINLCEQSLGICPATNDFVNEFDHIFA